MNPIVNAQLLAFEKANPNQNMEDNTLFEVFSVFAVCNGLLTNNIDPFQAHLKNKEFGIDGVAILVQGELCRNSDDVESIFAVGKNHDVEFNLFQTKSSEKNDYGDMSKFFDGAFSFFNNDFVDPSEQLADLIGAKETIYNALLKTNPVLRLYYSTTGTGELSKQLNQLIAATKTRFEELNIFSEIEINVIGAKELQAGYRSATNSISGTIEIERSIALPNHPAVQEAYLGIVSSEELLKLATIVSNDGVTKRINRGVFFDNVRDYDEKSKTNLGIIDDLKKNGHQSFVFKNNGVTVVAKSITRKNNSFRLEAFQIVNGCQTTNILFEAGAASAGVNVPFRLIGSEDPEFVANIIIGTNKQNEIREDQFWSLLPFMKSLEEYCREQQEDLRIFIERRENQYRDGNVERKRICKPRDLVKAIASMFLFQPHRAARDYRGVAQEFSNRLFQNDHSVVPYHAASFASYKLDFAIRNGRVDAKNSIYKHYVLAAIGLQYTTGKDIFSMPLKAQSKIGNESIVGIKNELDLIKIYKAVATIMEGLIAAQGITEREKIRDYIRGEGVYKLFHTQFMSYLAAASKGP